jgi:hypothetical protein
MTSDKRYQFQPWWVKAYRWLKFKPIYTAGAVMHICLWLIDGRATTDGVRRYRTRRARAWGIWTEYMSVAAYKMASAQRACGWRLWFPLPLRPL